MLHRIRRFRVIFDPDFKAGAASTDEARAYDVTATTVRIGLMAGGFRNSIRRRTPRRCCMWPGASRGVWSLLIGRRSGWLGRWQGQELGMAAAEVETTGWPTSRLRVCWDSRPDAGISPQDRALLGAAWVNAIAEFGGAAEVRKLYSAKTTKTRRGRGDESAWDNLDGSSNVNGRCGCTRILRGCHLRVTRWRCRWLSRKRHGGLIYRG